MNHMGRMLLVLSVLAAAAVVAHAESPWGIVTNGSFEESTFGPGGTWNFKTLYAPSDAIYGWTVTPESIDYINTYWTAADGDRSIDLDGRSPGGIKQDLTTVPGHDYLVKFWLSGNPDDGQVPKPVRVMALVGGGSWDFTYTFPSPWPSGRDKHDLIWQEYSLTFTAPSTLTTLQFKSTNSTAFGAALDNVSVVDQTPELPSGALLLLGMVPAGLAWWRRRG